MSFSAFNKRSQSSSVANTSHQATQQSEVSGTAASINGSGNTLNMLDGSAVTKAFDFGGYALDRTADLTLKLVEAQDKTNKGALSAMQESAAKGYQFAMDAGRSDVSTMQLVTKWGLAVVALLGVAYVWRMK